MRTLYQITAELYQEHVVPIINGKQYDTGRSVLITLTDAGAVVVPESGDMLRLYAKKPDGTVSYLPGTLSGTAVEVELTNQLQALPGIVECELQIGTGAEMVSTPVFRLNVLPSNYDAAAIESSDEFGALETALQTVQQYDTRIAALEDVADGLGDASTYGVANDLTQATAGENVLDAAQGKALGDRLTTAEGDIASLNDGYANLGCTYTLHTNTSEMVKESWKWNDGTLICAVRNRASASITNQSGGIYWAVIDGTSWPVAFTSTPTCTFNTFQSVGNCWCWASVNASATYAPQIYVGRGASAEVTVWIHYIAIGRWK